MSPKIFVFHYKKKVFGANRVLKNISEKDEHLEKKVPGNVRSWAPKWTSKSWFFIAKKWFSEQTGLQKK